MQLCKSFEIQLLWDITPGQLHKRYRLFEVDCLFSLHTILNKEAASFFEMLTIIYHFILLNNQRDAAMWNRLPTLDIFQRILTTPTHELYLRLHLQF
jgi:hypothetical protein